MQDFPHCYRVVAVAGTDGDVSIVGDGLDSIFCAPPVEFGGPGNRWSPETLLVAAVGNCFVLSFRAIARASKLSWVSLECEAEGLLDREQGTTKFTRFTVHAKLHVSQDTNEEKAHRILQKAEDSCLVTNSLSATTHLKAVVLVTP
jgi:peroxiredoxin-like protein